MPEGFPRILDETPRAEREYMKLLSRPDTVCDNPLTWDTSRFYDAWRSIAHEFSSCELTRSSDKLPAIEGVVKAISHATGDEYCTGLWTKDLVEQLAWKVGTDSTRLRHRIKSHAPSWAWPSVDNVVELPKTRSTARNYSAKVLLLLQSSTPASQSGCSPMLTSLRLRGHIFQLVFVPHRSSERWTWLHKSLMDFQNVEFAFLHQDDDIFDHIEGLEWSTEDDEHNERIASTTTYLATVFMCAYSCASPKRHEKTYDTEERYTGYGLAIERNSASDTWTRVGLVTFEDLSQELWDHLHQRRMTPSGHRPLETEDFDDLEGHTITLT